VKKKTASLVIFTGIFLITSDAFAWDNICSLGGRALALAEAQLEEFYHDKIDQKFLEGRGVVRTVWRSGVNKNYVVAVDCGNDIIVNVSTLSDVQNLKTGQLVDFEGNCISYGRRRYVYSKKTYMIFEFEKGSLR
jgi:hypothetical protein